ncbi:hypothetical protein ABZ619_30725 [Streptomyces sp. NPDC007851]|uniref:hypothetical protein n=1 Tax=Streptomyces sp. NPDC007851 TaxID=3155008 RepID=UPI0033EF315C
MTKILLVFAATLISLCLAIIIGFIRKMQGEETAECVTHAVITFFTGLATLITAIQFLIS